MKDYSAQRLSQRYRFADPNMDLFFLGASGWVPAGGLSMGRHLEKADDGMSCGNPTGKEKIVRLDAEKGCRCTLPG